jgi:outer membrane immunogenic protein
MSSTKSAIESFIPGNANMNRFLVAASTPVFIAIASQASAADLPARTAPVYTKAPVLPSPAYDWSGFYIGGHLGYDFGRTRVVDNGVLTESSVPMNGIIGGGLAGYNWQIGSFVYGIEGDFGVSDLVGHGRRADPTPPPPLTPNQYKVDLSGNIRGRVGFTVLPQTLLYAAGGLAMANFDFRENGGPIGASNTLTGWTIGAGIDQAFTKNLIGRIEYLYLDYGHKDFTIAPGDIYTIGFKSQIVRGALIWKF